MNVAYLRRYTGFPPLALGKFMLTDILNHTAFERTSRQNSAKQVKV